MTFLIDAYNLMHAVGYLSPKTPLNRMESSRRRLIDWLTVHVKNRPDDRFHVVFDAKSAPRPSADSIDRGVIISFAYQESADDYLERLLSTAEPKKTMLVSNDTIIQAAAKRRAIPFLACSAFVDELLAEPVTASVQVVVEKPIPKTNDDELLAVFSQPPVKRKR